MKELAVLILEDEPVAATRIVRLLRRIQDIGTIALATNGLDGLKQAIRMEPDLILLDVEMPRMSGIQFLDALPPEVDAEVIFTTAYEEYAVDAFKRRAVHYLTKPVRDEHLVDAVQRARLAIEARHDGDRVAKLEARMTQLKRKLAGDSPFLAEIWIPHRSSFSRITTEEIDWIEAERDYVRIHAGQGSHLLHQRLSSLERKLDPAEFMRVHRSAIVRLAAIRTLYRSGAGGLVARVRSGADVRISRSRAAALQRVVSAAKSGPERN